MPRKGSPVRIIATLGAITGLVSFFLMCVLSSLLYRLITGGKPPVSRVPFVILAYEGTILLGALAAFLGFLAITRLYPAKRPEAHDEAVTGDTFGIRVTCPPDQKEAVVDILKDAGAVEINESQY
jgi:molybdopterin-containing oxidoreductase family membrane subunit